LRGAMGGPSRRCMAVLLLGSTLTVMAGSVIVPVLEVIRSDLGLTGTSAGLLITTHGLTIAVTSPWAGKAVDRWGVRRPLAGGLLLYGAAGAAGALASSYPGLLATRVVFGLAASFVFTGTTVALLTMYTGVERDRVMGWRTTAISLGGIAWPLVGGSLGALSWRAPFAVYLIAVPIALATLALAPSGPQPSRGRTGRFASLLRAHPALLAWYGLQALGAVLLYALVVFLPQRLAELGVEAPVAVAVYVVLNGASASLTGLGYARARARLPYAVLFVLVAGAWTGSFSMLATIDAPSALLVAPVLFGAGYGLSFSALSVLVAEAVPAPLQGRATSLSATAIFLGQFASVPLLGPLIGATTTATGFLAAAVVAGTTGMAGTAVYLASQLDRRGQVTNGGGIGQDRD
jgi:MFS transporter, ACDE family, multidrug resistance protein